jgi:ATP-dependent RNA helicase DeaD
MIDAEQLHLTQPVGESLAALGWAGDDPRVRDAVPTAARGHNLAVVAPPAPAYGAPALAGLVSRLAANPPDGPALLLCPEAELDVWSGLLGALLRGTDLRLEVARGAARAARRLGSGALSLLVAPPEAMSALTGRGTLKGETLGAVVLAGPDRWADGEVLVSLMQDVPHDRQRIILASAPERAADLVERYARKALVLGAPADVPHRSLGPVRTVAVAWNRRTAALSELLELLDPQSLTIWTADRSQHHAIGAALPAGDDSIRVVTGDAPPAEVVIAFDPPDSPRLGQLLQAGDVVLLTPPGTESYFERVAAPRRPLRLPGPLEAVGNAAVRRRSAIARGIEAGRLERALLTLAPLFERYDATAVAAALYDLWAEAGAAAPPVVAPAPEPSATTSATIKVFVGVGKSDGATPNDLVAVLTKEVRVAREKIGRIELRDAYSLVELPAQEAERIASALNGATIRRKRVVARVDRGPTRPAGRAPGLGEIRRKG